MKIRDHLIVDCIAYMKRLHRGQTRRSSSAPYYTHPLGVLELMEGSPFFFTREDKCAALLHDVKEDSPEFSWEEIVLRYGRDVAGTVALLSKSKLGETSPEIYFTMMRLAHPKVIAIKLLDRIHNTSDANLIQDPNWLERYAEETVELVWPLVSIMVARGTAVSGGYYEFGVWVEDQLQHNVQAMRMRAQELRQEQANGKKKKLKSGPHAGFKSREKPCRKMASN